MKKIILVSAFLCGCPKKDMKSIDEIEREKQLQELIEADDEEFDSLPEANEENKS
tara:strand:+ start:300 stop:464 length:165 start_codon:yes stop_codon:yes gene_type:complete